MNNKKNFVLILLLSCLFLLAVILAGQSETSQQQTADLNTWPKLWLSWTSAQRTSFVLGYTTGYPTGHRGGCDDALKILTEHGVDLKPLREKQPKAGVRLSGDVELLSTCNTSRLQYPEQPVTYANRITDYYNRFPEDDISVDHLLWAMAWQNSWSSDRIHREFQPSLRSRD